LRQRIQFRLGSRTRPFLQRSESLFDKAVAGAFDRGAPHGERGSDDAILRPLSCFQQDTGTGHFAGRMRPARQQVFKLLALIVLHGDKIFFLGHRWSSSCE
jgi:hypothetical protein